MADVLDHLIEEHRKVEQMLADLKETDVGSERDDLFQQLTDSLRVHMAVEERFVYPLMAEHLGEEEAGDATDEHDLVRSALEEARQRLDDGAFEAAMEVLEKGIGHHVEEEESEQFPQLRTTAADELAQMDPDDLEAQVDSDDKTRDELYQEAKDADITGRSNMTKEELQDALSQS